jgi:hypothetical protein
VVAHATLSLLLAEVDRAPARSELGGFLSSVPARFAALFAGNIDVESLRGLVAVVFHCAVRVDAPKALRFATPALRAAIGLDRASREPRIAIIDGPPRGS